MCCLMGKHDWCFVHKPKLFQEIIFGPQCSMVSENGSLSIYGNNSALFQQAVMSVFGNFTHTQNIRTVATCNLNIH